uniref:Protein kinase domain-containing protein n=1 Tax=Macrostomum lignano TaxID=282301 RepID=A0A1I8JQ21_9PLAT
ISTKRMSLDRKNTDLSFLQIRELNGLQQNTGSKRRSGNFLMPGLPIGDVLLRPCELADEHSVCTLSVRSKSNDESRILVQHHVFWKANFGNSVVQVLVIFPEESGDDKQQTVVQEAEVMRALNHSKIVQLLVGMAKLVTYEAMLHMLQQIAEGMVYLEEKRLVHFDLRAYNIFECSFSGCGLFSDFQAGGTLAPVRHYLGRKKCM